MIILLIGISLLVAVGFLIAFLVAVKKGQYKDTHTPSVRILFENDNSEKKNPDISDNHKLKDGK